MVSANELWPGNNYHDNFVCRINTDGTGVAVTANGDNDCWLAQLPGLEPWEQDSEPDPVWVPPQAGMVPEVWPLCDDDPNTWTWRCTPPAQWQRGDGTVTPGGRPDDLPRAAGAVLEWSRWCRQLRGAVPCGQMLFNMSQALDYLGARRDCVLAGYTAKANYYSSQGSGLDVDYASDAFGWHLCSTVIDPLTASLPSLLPSNDVGYRLSDTPQITLAQRCRAVLTTPFPDIELETRGGGDYPPAIRFGQDCDAWASYVESRRGIRVRPQCEASMRLAEEWMEHVHGQHELYFRPSC